MFLTSGMGGLSCPGPRRGGALNLGVAVTVAGCGLGRPGDETTGGPEGAAGGGSDTGVGHTLGAVTRAAGVAEYRLSLWLFLLAEAREPSFEVLEMWLMPAVAGFEWCW